MNSTFRLLIVATALVAVLALVAGLTAESDRVRRERTTTEAAPAPTARVPRTVVDAKVPSGKPIEVQQGQTVKLTITLEKEETVTIDAIGFDETVAAGIPAEVLFSATVPGRFPFKLQNSGKEIGVLVVEPARGAAPKAPVKPERPATQTTPLGSAS